MIYLGIGKELKKGFMIKWKIKGVIPDPIKIIKNEKNCKY
jgi:hypothetical protein